MYDYHIHSNYSPDSSSTMLSMARSAFDSGLQGVCFTDHVDLDYADPEQKYGYPFSKYKHEIESIGSMLPGPLELYTGIELGLQPHISKENSEFLHGRDYDFIIGSIHCIGKKEMYRSCFLEGISDAQGIVNYFTDMLQCLDNFSDFDVLGHLDGVRRNLVHGEGGFSFVTYREYIEDVLKKLIKANKGIEVNTSGKRYNLSSYHPLTEIIKLYKDLGGEIITLGSDAHTPNCVGYDFKNALNLLSEIGFKYYTIFKKRKPIFIKIKE